VSDDLDFLKENFKNELYIKNKDQFFDLRMFTPLNIYNGTTDGRPNGDVRETLPINGLEPCQNKA
jgi:hypothetical protein